MDMKRVYIYCEGMTEEAFVNSVLYPYFIKFDIWVIPIVCKTGSKDGQKFRGGAVNYAKLKDEICKLCKKHGCKAYVTTLFDYYAMPTDTPNIECSDTDLYRRISIIENSIDNDIGMRNFFFNFCVHEFEGLLFSQPDVFAEFFDIDTATEIAHQRSEFPNPEFVNSSVHTAPSKRIMKVIPSYRKVSHGISIAQRIGIDKMIEECPHFRAWIEKIKSICFQPSNY